MPDVPKWSQARPCTASVAIAIQALRDGRATPSQQTMALDHVVNVMCGVQAGSFVPDNPMGTAWMEGRRAVGIELMMILAEPLENLIKKD